MARGLRFRGSSALEIKLPTHLSLGPVSIDALTLSAGVAGTSFPITLSADVKATLGVLDIVVQEIGIAIDLSFPPGGHGDIGPLAMTFRFKPPIGAGLAVDTGVLKGGGFLKFDPDAGEYFGALELSFQGVIDLKAFGIVNTKFPDGHKGFAFLVLITAEFAPIQLGFGFTLLGVGGLFSVNRTLDTPALMAGRQDRRGQLDPVPAGHRRQHQPDRQRHQGDLPARRGPRHRRRRWASSAGARRR